MARNKDVEIREKIKSIVDGLRKYWPLTVRQVYYQCVVEKVVCNDQKKYKAIVRYLTEMRVDEMISWSAIEDRVRNTSVKRGQENAQKFIQNEVNSFLKYYTRCRIQGQNRFIEIWLEKDALSKIFEEVAWPYCLRVSTCRGYNSTTKLKEYAERAEKAISLGQTPCILYFGDLDSSGVDMFESSQRKLKNIFDLDCIEYKRMAITPEIVNRFNLPHNPEAVKEKDTRTPKFRKNYGNIAVELDSLHPEILEKLIKESIESVIDMSEFEKQKTIEKDEQRRLESLRDEISTIINMRLSEGTI